MPPTTRVPATCVRCGETFEARQSTVGIIKKCPSCRRGISDARDPDQRSALLRIAFLVGIIGITWLAHETAGQAVGLVTALGLLALFLYVRKLI